MLILRAEVRVAREVEAVSCTVKLVLSSSKTCSGFLESSRSPSDEGGVDDLFELLELKTGETVVVGVAVAVDGDGALRALLLVTRGIEKKRD